MSKCSRSRIVLPVVSVLAVLALPAHGQDAGHEHKGNPTPHAAPAAKAPPAARQVAPRAAGGAPGATAAAHVGGGPGGNPRMHGGGPLPARNFAGHAYRGHMAWEGGRWRHEVHN